MANPLLSLGYIAWISQLIGSLVAYLAKYFTKKISVRVVAIGGLIAITTAFTALIHGAILSIAFAAPGGFTSLGLSLLPGNTEACLGAYMTSYVARWVYDYHAGFMSRMLDQGL